MLQEYDLHICVSLSTTSPYFFNITIGIGILMHISEGISTNSSPKDINLTSEHPAACFLPEGWVESQLRHIYIGFFVNASTSSISYQACLSECNKRFFVDISSSPISCHVYFSWLLGHSLCFVMNILVVDLFHVSRMTPLVAVFTSSIRAFSFLRSDATLYAYILTVSISPITRLHIEGVTGLIDSHLGIGNIWALVIPSCGQRVLQAIQTIIDILRTFSLVRHQAIIVCKIYVGHHSICQSKWTISYLGFWAFLLFFAHLSDVVA